MIFGIADGDRIVNVIAADSMDIAQAVAGAGVEIVPDAGRDWVRTDDGWAAAGIQRSPRALTGMEFELLVQEAAGLTNEDVLTLLDAPALRLFWRRLNQANLIAADHPLVGQGLDALVALGHLTDAQRQAVLDAWPVA